MNGDAFRLRYASPGPVNGWYVTAAATDNDQRLWLTNNSAAALPLRFTVGYSGQPGFPSGTFVRTTGLVYLQYAATWAPDSKNQAYVRVPDKTFFDPSYCVFGQDDGWWYSEWYVTNAGRNWLGWGLTWGSQITLEYHALNGNLHWLPRKMLPHSADRQWLGVGNDGDYANPNVGRWIIERV